MAVEIVQFRVAGVDIDTGEDVSIVIEAATKAAAEVKAEKLKIDTTHIVRLKRADDAVADEHTQYLLDAAEARSTTPTDKLIEEVVPQETPRETLTAAAPPTALTTHAPTPTPTPVPTSMPQQEPVVLAAISRPAYSAPTVKWTGKRPTGTGALVFVAAVLCGIAAGGYYVLVQQPMSANADEASLYGDDLFDAPEDVAQPTQPQQPRLNNANAFGQRPGQSQTNTPPRQTEQAQPTTSQPPQATPRVRLELQSVVVSHEGRFAVLNGKLTPEGDTVAGCTLVNVGDDWVLLERNGEQFVLRIVPNADAE